MFQTAFQFVNNALKRQCAIVLDTGVQSTGLHECSQWVLLVDRHQLHTRVTFASKTWRENPAREKNACHATTCASHTRAYAHLIPQIVICSVQTDSQQHTQIAADIRDERHNAARGERDAAVTDGDAVTCVCG
jgi:hypothetical protein